MDLIFSPVSSLANFYYHPLAENELDALFRGIRFGVRLHGNHHLKYVWYTIYTNMNPFSIKAFVQGDNHTKVTYPFLLTLVYITISCVMSRQITKLLFFVNVGLFIVLVRPLLFFPTDFNFKS